MDDVIQKAVDMSLGAVVSAKEALDKLGAELTERGREVRGRTTDVAGEVREKGRAEKETILQTAETEMQRILEKAHIATTKDVARLQEKLAAAEARLAALEGKAPSSGDGSPTDMGS